MRVCRRCGGTGNVRWRVCEACRTRTPAVDDRRIEWRAEEPEHRLDHDQPWVPHSAFTRRTRRSPRS